MRGTDSLVSILVATVVGATCLGATSAVAAPRADVGVLSPPSRAPAAAIAAG